MAHFRPRSDCYAHYALCFSFPVLLVSPDRIPAASGGYETNLTLWHVRNPLLYSIFEFSFSPDFFWLRLPPLVSGSGGCRFDYIPPTNPESRVRPKSPSVSPRSVARFEIEIGPR